MVSMFMRYHYFSNTARWRTNCTVLGILSGQTYVSQEFMADWYPALDRSTGRTYYYNKTTRESSWKLPGSTVVHDETMPGSEQVEDVVSVAWSDPEFVQDIMTLLFSLCTPGVGEENGDGEDPSVLASDCKGCLNLLNEHVSPFSHNKCDTWSYPLALAEACVGIILKESYHSQRSLGLKVLISLASSPAYRAQGFASYQVKIRSPKTLHLPVP